jgi:hypothetical protein
MYISKEQLMNPGAFRTRRDSDNSAQQYSSDIFTGQTQKHIKKITWLA